jgi:membrane protease YdiL (CAAX protease family)
MAGIPAFVKKHPLLAFYVLTFVISWGGILLIAGGPSAIRGNDGQLEKVFLPVYLTLLAGPSLAGILLTGLTEGRAGLREFGSRLLRWRVGARWYAVALLTAPLVTSAVLYALSLASRDFLPRIVTASDRAFLLQFSIISALTVGVLEELGWTGYATPRLRQRFTVLETGLIVGLLKGVWNSLVVYWVSAATGSFGGLPLVLFLVVALFSWVPAYRVLMAWVYDRTGSLLVAILMHTALVTFWTMATPLTITGVRLLIYYLVWTAAMWLLIGIAVAVNRRQPSSQPPHPRIAA